MTVRCAHFDKEISDNKCIETQRLNKPVCYGCKEGKASRIIKKFIQTYSSPSGVVSSPSVPADRRIVAKNHIRAHKKGNVGSALPKKQNKQLLYDLEILLKAQIAYIFELAHEGKINEALSRLRLTDKAIEQSLTGDGRTPSACHPLSTEG